MTKKIIYTEKAPKAIGPYSQAVSAGGFTYVSGQIAINPETGDLMNASVKDQAEQVLKNLIAICEEAKGSLADIVKLTIYITNMNDFAVVNETMQKYFSEPYPARATVEVSALPLGVNVEMDAVLVNHE
jgi:2-iminobutanoate/2-iminopropanoate deaminase|tara:strand:- start:2863 stop:3249 length:387 start_codon:yes stop_codon:yes gene_type:complete